MSDDNSIKRWTAKRKAAVLDRVGVGYGLNEHLLTGWFDHAGRPNHQARYLDL